MDDQFRPSQDQARAALAQLRAYLRDASPAERAALDMGQDLSRTYPQDFVPDAAYLAQMPDLQNGPASLIRGAHVPIQHVGIAGFRVPLTYQGHVIETRVTGSVSLEAERKGINMSRIMRSFYRRKDEAEGFALIDAVLTGYLNELDALDARLQLDISYPFEQQSLRSNLSGFQYYNMSLEGEMRAGHLIHVVHFDYVYSSTCPCSLELAEHARQARGQLATPHSQRSIARLSAVMRPGAQLPAQDLIAMCRAAVPTETQVMVKREDEQAFAELNAANPIFVEDAVRLFAQHLEADSRVGDFRVVAVHEESLHSHDAVSVLSQGARFSGPLEPQLLRALAARL